MCLDRMQQRAGQKIVLYMKAPVFLTAAQVGPRMLNCIELKRQVKEAVQCTATGTSYDQANVVESLLCESQAAWALCTLRKSPWGLSLFKSETHACLYE